MLSTVCDKGLADGTRGFLSLRPRYVVERSMIHEVIDDDGEF
jgi:hypothetical protein